MSSPVTSILLRAGKKVAGRRVPSLGRAVADRFGELAGDSKGTILLETVIATIVFALVGTEVLAGLSTMYKSGSVTEKQSVAENIARNQMEFVFSQPYREPLHTLYPRQTPYPTISDIGGTPIPANYSVDIVVEHADNADPDPEVEKITVTSRHDGEDILSLQTLRGRTDGLQRRYSPNNDRSDSARLEDATIGGTVYVFLDDPELLGDNLTEFYLDGGVAPVQTEIAIPWDYAGGDDTTANPWDTTGVIDGPQQIAARILLKDGNTIVVTADFEVSNP
jgi:type II secretory pathway pseudopilin PulG